jgi:hypothetical protein
MHTYMYSIRASFIVHAYTVTHIATLKCKPAKANYSLSWPMYIYPIIIFNDSDLTFEPPCLNSVLEETLHIRNIFVHVFLPCRWVIVTGLRAMIPEAPSPPSLSSGRQTIGYLHSS